MGNRPFALAAVLTALAAPAAAEYAHAPFHETPVAVAELALGVLDGDPVAVPRNDPPLTAAVAALLLISEVGLAEAFEEAVDGEGGDYEAAYGLLQSARPWIDALPEDAESAALVARLDALMPTPARPPALDADPEAAEVVAQALVGRLERVADADLYLARDLRRAIATVSGIAEDACGLDDAASRTRRIGIAALYFEDALEAPLSVMAPDPAERIEDALDGIAAGETRACAALAGAFAEARETLYPGSAP